MKWKLCSAVKRMLPSDYYKHFTGREWMDARNYDLVLDTSRYTYQQCAEMIEAIVAERMKD